MSFITSTLRNSVSKVRTFSLVMPSSEIRQRSGASEVNPVATAPLLSPLLFAVLLLLLLLLLGISPKCRTKNISRSRSTNSHSSPAPHFSYDFIHDGICLFNYWAGSMGPTCEIRMWRVVLNTSPATKGSSLLSVDALVINPPGTIIILTQRLHTTESGIDNCMWTG